MNKLINISMTIGILFFIGKEIIKKILVTGKEKLMFYGKRNN